VYGQPGYGQPSVRPPGFPMPTDSPAQSGQCAGAPTPPMPAHAFQPLSGSDVLPG
jgi:hypothetical protein